jgi:predicted transcriptional regulator
MTWKPRDITETELAVVQLLWKRGPSTIRDLTDRLYPDGGHSHYATVQSLLDRLEQKGFVERSKHGRVNVFTPTVSRADLIARRLRATADALCDGSMAPLLTQLVGNVDLSGDELATLERLIGRLDGERLDDDGGV